MWLQIDITYKCFPFHWIVSNIGASARRNFLLSQFVTGDCSAAAATPVTTRTSSKAGYWGWTAAFYQTSGVPLDFTFNVGAILASSATEFTWQRRNFHLLHSIYYFGKRDKILSGPVLPYSDRRTSERDDVDAGRVLIRLSTNEKAKCDSNF